MAEKELTDTEIESFRKELADIKADLMRKELEEIKRERMRKELEVLRAERESAPAGPPKTVYVQSPPPGLSWLNFAGAVVMLLVAGYMVGTIFTNDLAGKVDSYQSGLPLQVPGNIVIAAMAIIIAAIGAGLVTIARK